MSAPAPCHRLVVELVEPFQLPAARGGVPRRRWERFPSRLPANAERALALLDRHGARATFLADDWIAARHGAVLAEIARRGHEVAGWWDASADPLAGQEAIEAATGLALLGARVGSEPPPGLAWAQGGAGAVAPEGAGERGERLRLLPEPLVARFIAGYARAAAPRGFAFRLWELDPEAERLAVLTPAEGLRAYRGRAAFPARLDRLLAAARFGSVADSLGLAPRPAPARPARPAIPHAPAPAAPRGEPLTVVVPCFNEEEGLPVLARTLAGLDEGLGRRHPLAFVLVDDGSADGTWAAMERLFGADPRVARVRHERNRGVGAAILTGIRAAPTELFAVIDSDCSYDPARIGDLLDRLAPDVALVTASPYHPEGGVSGVPEWRLMLSRSASWLYRRVLRTQLATYTSCFRVGRRSALDGIALRHDGYIGVVEMLARLDLAGRRIVEHPVVLESRLLGRSKIRILRVTAGHLRFLAEILVTSRKRPASDPSAPAIP